MYSALWELLLLCENIQYVSAFERGVWQCNECCVVGLCVFLVEGLKAMASPLCSPFSVAVWHAAHWPRNGPHSSHLQLWMNQRGEAIVDIEGRVGGTSCTVNWWVLFFLILCKVSLNHCFSALNLNTDHCYSYSLLGCCRQYIVLQMLNCVLYKWADLV